MPNILRNEFAKTEWKFYSAEDSASLCNLIHTYILLFLLPHLVA